MIPDHLVRLAVLADLPGARPESAAAVAHAMLRHLPHDEPEVCWARLCFLEREVRAASKVRGEQRRALLAGDGGEGQARPGRAGLG